MSRGLQWVIGISAVVVALAIVFAVLAPWILPWSFGGRYGPGMMGGGMMGGYGQGSGYGPGMMGGYGQGMMGGYGQGSGFGPGMMGGYGQGMMGGQGVMPWGGYGPSAASGQRLSIEEARTAVEAFATTAGADLVVSEVMEFDLNFYAVFEEHNTGRGALEVLVDPYTGAVGLEPGPNMMWNQKYGPMGRGAGGEAVVSMEDARQQAQRSLEAQLPGGQVHEEGTAFYGYYTFDYDGPDGTIAGMLSVDAYNGAVWIHTWHGGFVQEWEAEGTGS
jgi:hypothetical protein